MCDFESRAAEYAAPTGGEAPPAELSRALRQIASGAGGLLESTGEIDTPRAHQVLRQAGAQHLMDRAEAALNAIASAGRDDVSPGLHQGLLDRLAPLTSALTGELTGALTSDTPETLDTGTARAALEALVRLTGRPALRVRADGSTLDDPALGPWREVLSPIRARWRPYVQAVGRIDVEVTQGRWVHAGTGLYSAEGRVLTNRHVIDAFTEPLAAPPGEQAFRLKRPASIIFDPEAQDEATRYPLPRVVTAGAHRVGRFVNLRKLDLAVLEMVPENAHAAPAPRPVSRGAISAAAPDLQRLLVVGYPARPKPPLELDPDSEEAQFWARIGEIFGDAYGVKYLSPGSVMARPGALEADPKGWSFTHDATTLGGNSGSAVLALQGAVRLAGLHFGGNSRTENYAHDLVALRPEADGVFDPDALPEAFE